MERPVFAERISFASEGRVTLIATSGSSQSFGLGLLETVPDFNSKQPASKLRQAKSNRQSVRKFRGQTVGNF